MTAEMKAKQVEMEMKEVAKKEVPNIKLVTPKGEILLRGDMPKSLARLVKTINDKQATGEHEVRITMYKGRLLFVYPSVRGRQAFVFRTLDDLGDYYISSAPTDTLELELKRCFKMVKSSTLAEADKWCKFAVDYLRLPRDWSVITPRWIKTMRILYLSLHLADLDKDTKLPSIKDIRKLVGMMKPTDKLTVTSSKDYYHGVLYNEETLDYKVLTTVLQDDSLLVPGYRISDKQLKNCVSHDDYKMLIPVMELKPGKPSVAVKHIVNGDNQAVSREVIFYVGAHENYKNIHRTAPHTFSLDELYDLMQKVSVSLQFPLAQFKRL